MSVSSTLLAPVEGLLVKKAHARFRERRFFEKVWLLALLCIPLQLYAQFFSFNSECQFLLEQVIMGNSNWNLFQAYSLALVFELVKATIIGLAIRQFFLSYTEFIWWALAGLLLSFGSWWMSDQGTFYLAKKAVGSSPTDERTSQITAIYTPQIEQLSEEMLDLERKNFWWCGLHRTKHTNEECNANASGFYINPNERSDRLAKAEIADLKKRRTAIEEQMNRELSLASSAHQQALGNHQAFFEQQQLSLQTKVLMSELVIWLCTLTLSYILFCLYQYKKEVGENEKDPKEKRLYVKRNGVLGEKEASEAEVADREAEATVMASETHNHYHNHSQEDVQADGHKINCDNCGQEAILKHPGRFCTAKCRMAWHRERLREERS